MSQAKTELEDVSMQLRIRCANIGCRAYAVVTERESLLRVGQCLIEVKTPRQIDLQTDWLARALRDGQILWHVELPSTGKVHNLMETVVDKLGVRDFYVVDMDTAFEWATQRQARLERDAMMTEGKIEQVFEHRDHKVFELFDAQALRREGLIMHHCVGDEGRYPLDPVKRRIFSIRDSEGKSHATIEVKNGVSGIFDTPYDPPKWIVAQARGPMNENLEPIIKSVYEAWTAHVQIFDRKLTDAGGSSAYQSAVDMGFIGTREQWLESLVRPGIVIASGDIHGDVGFIGSGFESYVASSLMCAIGAGARLDPEILKQLLPEVRQVYGRIVRTPAQLAAPPTISQGALAAYDPPDLYKHTLLIPVTTENSHGTPSINSHQREAQEEAEAFGGRTSTAVGMGQVVGRTLETVGEGRGGKGSEDQQAAEDQTPSLGLGGIRGH